jgi:hypothetical protein
VKPPTMLIRLDCWAGKSISAPKIENNGRTD